MKNLKGGYGFAPLLVLALLALVPSRARAELVMDPKHVGAYIDFGQAQKKQDKQALNRTGVYLTVSGTHDEHLKVIATLGGLFWYGFPEVSGSARLVKFGPGVGEAQAIYSFGEDPANPHSTLQFGLFNYKTNPDANNLGEYLYRSGTYPGYVWNGGWSYINSASYLMQGVHYSLPTFGGKVTHDFTVHMERDVAQPLHDLSLGYTVTAKPAEVVELGAGVVWSNALSFNSKRLSPKDVNNAYSKNTNMPVKGLTDFSISSCSSSDTSLNKYCADPDTVRARQTLADWNNCDTAGNCGDVGFYTFRGFKAMARASVDFGKLIGSPIFRPGDLKLYGEVALLGVEDQPFYYEDKMERMPMMVGLNVPTLGLLDRLAVEVEYRKSRYKNTFIFPYDNLGAIPIPLDDGNDSPYEYLDSRVNANEGDFTKDDLKWSVFATRQITQGVTLSAQVASDNFRPYNGEAKPSSEPYTSGPKDWYYVVRAGIGF